MKTVFDIMDKTEASLLDFDAAVEEAAASKFIVAESKISTILQNIAKSKYLYDLMGECTKDFDFKAISEKLMSGGGKLDLETLERKKRIAYVFALLYSFDIRQNELLKFIQKHYGSNNVNSEYSQFCKDILVPFKFDVFSHLAESV